MPLKPSARKSDKCPSVPDFPRGRSSCSINRAGGRRNVPPTQRFSRLSVPMPLKPSARKSDKCPGFPTRAKLEPPDR
jgi:hypothetical protein